MAESSTKSRQILRPEQKPKLKEILDNIVTRVSIDFTNQELQDIRAAVHRMLERVVARMNERGVFSVARIQPTGSMVDKTAIWKYDEKREEHFIEFDFLAVLENSVGYHSIVEEEHSCPGCIDLVNAPVKLKRLRQCYIGYRQYTAETLKYKEVISELFLNEINWCLSLLCDCLIVTFHKKAFTTGRIKFQPRSSGHEHACDRCAIDMPTGTLSVNSYIYVDHYFNDGPSKCSMIFLWTSKAKSLSAPQDQDQDSLLVKRRNDNHSPGPVIRELVPSSHQRSELSNTILCIFSG